MLQDPRPEYKLFGTIVHSGFSAESGHYYAYIKVIVVGNTHLKPTKFITISDPHEFFCIFLAGCIR